MTTIVNASLMANSVGIETGDKWVYNDTIVTYTAIFGFTHAGASGNSSTSFAARSFDNVTDAPTDDSGNATWMGVPGNYPVDMIPGTIYGASVDLLLSTRAAIGAQRAMVLLLEMGALSAPSVISSKRKAVRTIPYLVGREERLTDGAGAGKRAE
jgi:hypothetical protein